MDELAKEQCLRIFRDGMGVRSEEILNALSSDCRLAEYEKGECVFRMGERMEYCPFLVSGSFYMFVRFEDGKDIVCCICDEYGEPAVPFSELEDFTKPLICTMEALEPLTLLLFPTETIMPLIGSCPELTGIMAQFVRKWNDIHGKMALYNTFPIAERYEAFRQMYPNLFARVPQNMIARLLNVTPASLSRAINN